MLNLHLKTTQKGNSNIQDHHYQRIGILIVPVRKFNALTFIFSHCSFKKVSESGQKLTRSNSASNMKNKSMLPSLSRSSSTGRGIGIKKQNETDQNSRQGLNENMFNRSVNSRPFSLV